MSSSLRKKVIRLAHAKPELRKDLLSLLREAAAQTRKAAYWTQLADTAHLGDISLNGQIIDAFVDRNSFSWYIGIGSSMMAKGKAGSMQDAQKTVEKWLDDHGAIF